MRIVIDGEWGAMEFAEFFSVVSHMYYAPKALTPMQVNLLTGGEPYGVSPTDDLDRILRAGTSEENVGENFDRIPFKRSGGFSADYSDAFEKVLYVTRIQYGSPGFADFTGAGALMREIRLLIQYLCEKRQRLNSLELDNAERDIRISAMRKLLYDYGQSRPEDSSGANDLRINLDGIPDELLYLISDRKIVSAEE